MPNIERRPRILDFVEGTDVETHRCVICGGIFTGYGNNPDPIAEDGRCCDSCNAHYVIPARLNMIREASRTEW